MDVYFLNSNYDSGLKNPGCFFFPQMQLSVFIWTERTFFKTHCGRYFGDD